MFSWQHLSHFYAETSLTKFYFMVHVVTDPSSPFFKDICLRHRDTLEFSIFTSKTAAGGALNNFLVAVSAKGDGFSDRLWKKSVIGKECFI
jgi:hypothetical protein